MLYIQGSQRMGRGQNLLKNLRAFPFSKDLSNETIFSPIHSLDSTFKPRHNKSPSRKMPRNPNEGCFGHTT